MRMLMSLDTSTTLRRGCVLVEVHHHADDLVVGLAVRERRRQRRGDEVGLQEQAAGGGAARLLLQRDALRDALDAGLGVRGDELVEEARRLAGVARDLGGALLVGVELLERQDGQVDVVLLEPEQARRVVHQDVGVEDEQLGDGRRAGLGRLAGGRQEVQRGGSGAELAFDHGPPGKIWLDLAIALSTASIDSRRECSGAQGLVVGRRRTAVFVVQTGQQAARVAARGHAARAR